MDKPRHLRLILLCAAISLGAVVFNSNAATPGMEVTLSVGSFGVTWPVDAQLLYARLQRMADDIRLLARAVTCHAPPPRTLTGPSTPHA